MVNLLWAGISVKADSIAIDGAPQLFGVEIVAGATTRSSKQILVNPTGWYRCLGI